MFSEAEYCNLEGGQVVNCCEGFCGKDGARRILNLSHCVETEEDPIEILMAE